MKPGIIRCPNCDAPLRKTAKVCPRCETRLDDYGNTPESSWLPYGSVEPVAGVGIVEKTNGDASTSVKCPSCGSEQVTAQKQGYGLGKGLVGGVALGLPGLLAGLIGKNKIEVTCIKCGKKWKV